MALEKGKIVGPTGILGSGAYFDFDNPLAATITLDDIAYGLAHEGRWGGQCILRYSYQRVFFSVAQHCVMACDHAETDLKYAALMHELDEFMAGDMLGPLKKKVPQFKELTKTIGDALKQRLKVPNDDETNRRIKVIDLRLMATERRDITAWDGKDHWGYIGDSQPFESRVVPLSPADAALAFRSRFRQYAPDDVMASMEAAEKAAYDRWTSQ